MERTGTSERVKKDDILWVIEREVGEEEDIEEGGSVGSLDA